MKTGQIDHNVEPAITSAMGVVDPFVRDVIDFAADAAQRVQRDHKSFRAYHSLGAFHTPDLVYR